MRRSRLRTPAGLLSAAFIAILLLAVAWLAVRTAAVQMLSGPNARAGALVAGQPTVVLGAAMGGLVANRGAVNPRALPAVRDAAVALPLDARPYLLIGSDYLRAGRLDQATLALEAGRRLDPRQRWIHILLLNRYLRQGRFAQAGEELAVLSRLVGSAQGPIATALAQMSVAPQTRDAVRATLRQDPALERSVLTSLASSGVEPTTIFAMATPSAWAAAGAPGAWGTVLIDRLVTQRRYRLSRLVWQRINRLTDAQVAPLLYDPALQMLPGKPPFNWTLASNNVASVDVRGGKFDIEYYGRESGDLANQLLLLPPGAYRFGFVVSGVQQGTAPSLSWSVTCEDRPDRTLAAIAVPLNNNRPHAVGGRFAVPADCPAQRLRLNGLAGEFPVVLNATIEGLRLERATAP